MNYTNHTFNYTGVNGLGATGSSGDLFLLIIVIIVSVRLYRNAKGTKFSRARVVFLPALYLLITIIAMATASMTYLEYGIAAVAFIIGIMFGARFGKGVQFFDKDEKTYYKRSAVVMSIWVVSYIIRYGAALFLANVPYVAAAINIVLALTTGMIAGEAFHIYMEHSTYVKNKGSS